MILHLGERGNNMGCAWGVLNSILNGIFFILLSLNTVLVLILILSFKISIRIPGCFRVSIPILNLLRLSTGQSFIAKKWTEVSQVHFAEAHSMPCREGKSLEPGNCYSSHPSRHQFSCPETSIKHKNEQSFSLTDSTPCQHNLWACLLNRGTITINQQSRTRICSTIVLWCYLLKLCLVSSNFTFPVVQRPVWTWRK